MKSKHRNILLLYSPWVYTAVSVLVVGFPFLSHLLGISRLELMGICGPLGLPVALVGFYMCFRSRNVRFKDLAIWTNIAALVLSFIFIYIVYL